MKKTPLFNDLRELLESVGISMSPKCAFEKFLAITGANLRAARLANSLDIETAASAVGMPPERLQLIENGQFNWEVRDIANLCAYYKIPAGTVGKESL